MTQNHTVPSTTNTTVAATNPKLKIRIPTTGSDGNIMTFIHVISDTEWQTITRQEFFELVRSTPNADEHVVPDIEGAIVYFVPDEEKYTIMSQTFCREAEKERKRNIRHNKCVYRGTGQCDGWTNNPDRKNKCETCDRRYISKTFSLNEAHEDDDGNITDFGDMLYDNTVPSVEDIVQDSIDVSIIRSAVACLREDDRKFLEDALRVGMNYSELGRLYGIAPRRANRRFERIKKQICKRFVK